MRAQRRTGLPDGKLEGKAMSRSYRNDEAGNMAWVRDRQGARRTAEVEREVARLLAEADAAIEQIEESVRRLRAC